MEPAGMLHRLQLSPPRVVAPTADRCGEGAVWHAGEQALYWTDVNRFLIHRVSVADGSVRFWLFDEPVVALGLTTDDNVLIVALGSRIILWEPRTDTRRDHGFVLDGWPQVRLNDGRPGPAGDFWFGSMRNNVGRNGEAGPAGGTDGVLFRLGSEGATIHRSGLGISNTVAWSPDRTRFYFGDTLANTIWVHDFDAARGTLGEPRVFFAGFERGVPDGSTVDAEGYLWNCRFDGGCIVRVSPAGEIAQVIEMPVSNITTCTFGGADLSTLFITTAGATAPPHERLAGSLFAIETSTKGQPENRFKLAIGHGAHPS
jgi:sugar lactone lactonase YvrE